jgi:hypothetical protein
MLLLFRDPQDLTETEAIEERANPPVTSVGMPLATTFVIAAIAMGLTANPIVAGAAASVPAMNIWKKLGKKFKNELFLRSNPGAIAHLIKKDDDMIAWMKLHGKDDVAQQLLLAKEKRQPFTSCATKTLKQLVPVESLPPKKVEDFLARIPEGESGKIEAPVPAGSGSQGKALVGKTMQNTNAEKPYVPGAGGMFNPQTGKGSVLLDQVLHSPGISRLIIGGQRTGKSYFAAVASRELVKQGWKIFHVNLASYGDEDSYYWHHAHRTVTGDLASIQNEDHARDLIDDAIDCINEFIQTEQSILIADEVSITGSKYGKWDASSYMRLLAEQISALTSTGTKRKRAIWALCPELRAGAMKDALKAIKSLRLLYFAIAPGRFVEWEGQKITFSDELHQQIADNFKGTQKPSEEEASLCRRHGIDRLAYINGTWMPVGELPAIEKIATPIPDEWEAIGIAMAGVAAASSGGGVTYDQPGRINEMGVKTVMNQNYLLRLIEAVKNSDQMSKVNKEATLERGKEITSHGRVDVAIEFLEKALGIL